MIIGIDESGTGAWAGPFTVCGIALREADQSYLRSNGVKDSKRLTDHGRRRLVDLIVERAVIGACVFVEVEDIRKFGQKEAWRKGVLAVVLHMAKTGNLGSVVIDGNEDELLRRRVLAFTTDIRFEVKADVHVPAVSAASIVAKTLRNDRMIKLDKEYNGDYGWSVNAGYGTPDHQKAIDKYGKTIHHRPVKNLDGVSLRTQRSR